MDVKVHFDDRRSVLGDSRRKVLSVERQMNVGNRRAQVW